MGLPTKFEELTDNEKLALRYAIAFPFGGVGDALIKLNAVTNRGEPNYRKRQKGEESLIEKGLVRVLKSEQTIVLPYAFDLLSREEAIVLLQMLTTNVTEKIQSIKMEERTDVGTQNNPEVHAEILDRVKRIENMVSRL